MTTDVCDACQQAHKKCWFVVRPFRPRGQRISRPRRPHEDSFPCPLKYGFVHPPSNGHFTPRPERSDYPADEGWQWQEDIQTWANCHHVLSPMGFKRQSPSGTQWSEELFREPSRTKEPPSPSFQPPEDKTSREPEPEVAPMQSTEEPFAFPATPRSIIIIDDTPIGSPPVQSPSHSHNDTRQEFTNLRPTLMIPRAIVHKLINQILLEHRRLLHMIPFVDATH
ncbi:hypothetical protein O181_057645 [Austropuccinia psidii MF-1]|uniref:Uncharacterized protein n=1 Tax=Austropuccinia psidii MF-1 TaxID=1389203 RepID=A0A9Q3HX66_9BASI|nr:hypothetical protein [Austropuccinia psidii MF-1]